jgi:hypothetical protein
MYYENLNCTNHNALTCLGQFSDLNASLIHPTLSDCVIWLGDFNCHHPMWEEDINECLFKPEDYIIDLLYKNDMLLMLLKGIPMLQTPAGNWTRPDNIWQCNTPDNPIICCNTVPAIHPPLADHMPIITTLDLPLPHLVVATSLDFRATDWTIVHSNLSLWLEAESPATCIRSKEEFYKKVDVLVHIISEVLDKNLDERQHNPYKQQWWTKELTELKKMQNHLSRKSFKFHHLREHPIHAKYRTSANKLKEAMKETHKQD